MKIITFVSQGKKTDVMVPKPGEFFVVSSDQVPSLNRKLMSQAMRESTERALSGADPNSMHATKSRQTQLAMTDRTQRKSVPRKGSHVLAHPSLQQQSITTTSLEGELNKHMSLPSFKKADMTKHDFPKNKLFAEADGETVNIGSKYDVTSIQDGKSADVAAELDPIPEHIRSK